MKPVLYSYRRCPYAMRARMALIDAQIDFEVREISLRNKPVSMLQISPKGTVPVLLLEDKRVLEQSIDIMLWAYQTKPVRHRVFIDPLSKNQLDSQMMDWIILNDEVFKKILDAYKYPERFPLLSPIDTLRQALTHYLHPIENQLSNSPFLLGNELSLVDIALFPFVRQFIRVNPEKFQELNLVSIHRWVEYFQESAIYLQAMMKYPTWMES